MCVFGVCVGLTFFSSSVISDPSCAVHRMISLTNLAASSYLSPRSQLFAKCRHALRYDATSGYSLRRRTKSKGIGVGLAGEITPPEERGDTGPDMTALTNEREATRTRKQTNKHVCNGGGREGTTAEREEEAIVVERQSQQQQHTHARTHTHT